MPKPKKQEVLSDDGSVKTIEVEVSMGDVTKKTTYTVPSNPAKFQELVLNASADKAENEKESPLDYIYRMYVSAVDKAARADIYEAATQESTFITVGKDRVNIMDFPVNRLVQGINGMRAQRSLRMSVLGEGPEAEKAADRAVGFGPWRTAAKKLVEDGKAKENDSTGLLELVG